VMTVGVENYGLRERDCFDRFCFKMLRNIKIILK
jgi:hypothetical protein